MKINVLLFPLLLLLNLISCQLDGIDDDDHMIKKTKVFKTITYTLFEQQFMCPWPMFYSITQTN